MAFEVTLNGANYVSEERQRAFEQALKGNVSSRVRGSGNGKQDVAEDDAVAGVAPATGEPVVETSARAPTDAAESSEARISAATGVPADYTEILESLERGLTKSYEHQSATLQVHERYLDHEASYATIFAQLMQEQGALFDDGHMSVEQSEAALKVLQSLAQSLERFHAHQSDTLSVHDRFLAQQSTYAEAFVGLLQAQYGAILQSNGHKNGHSLKSENGGGNGTRQAGLPVNPAAATPQASSTPSIRSDMPAAKPAPDGVPSQGTSTTEAPLAQAISQDRAGIDAGGLAIDAEMLAASLLEIVSEKTGYPAEMLELEMDMEADLGIDSIKRVEILGALQDQYPDLPEVETDALAELRTLAQVVAYTETRTEAADAADLTEQTSATAPSPHVESPMAVAGDAETIRQDLTGLGQALLEIVSDKTGYPAEMLELDMDMEADLGIDSIKRVEILGALQDRYPDLPEVETDALAELRTLAQVVAYTEKRPEAADAADLTEQTSAAAPPPHLESPMAAADDAETSQQDLTGLGQALLEIVSEKTGYPAEMLELDMDMEADLGIDSIKRVEILGALQDRYPDLPEVETDRLAELRTLEQVMAHVAEGLTSKKG